MNASDVFFYGLFMDEKVLRDNGVHPRAPRKAVVHGYRLKIGRRAMLVPRPDAKAFGMVFALTERETEALYGEPGLELYRPEPVTACFEDGTSGAVTTFNLRDPAAAGEPSPEYAARLRAVLERQGFPADDLRSAE